MIAFGMPLKNMPEITFTNEKDGNRQIMTSYAFIVFPKIQFGSLLDLLMNANTKGVKLSHDTQQYLCADLLRSVAALHADGLAHLDIKPDNVVMLENDNRLLKMALIDFGSADSVSSYISRWSTTFIYAPPEVRPFNSL